MQETAEFITFRPLVALLLYLVDTAHGLTVINSIDPYLYFVNYLFTKEGLVIQARPYKTSDNVTW